MSTGLTDELFDIYESQYARDFEGRLIRIEKAVQKDLETVLDVKVDGKEIKVPKAVPATDDQGKLLRDRDGLLVPRLSTIYDAANRRYTTAARPGQPVSETRNPIPVLCHQNHVKPVGVCRVCSVLTVRRSEVATRLVPACQHPIVAGMEVHTVASQEAVKFPGEKEPRSAGEHVRNTVRVLVELLAAAHLHQGQAKGGRTYHNELLELAARFRVPLRADGTSLTPETPFARRPHDRARRDDSSPVIALDHNQCILCDRCVRACSEVKPFQVVGHTGFGNRATISFDLGRPMGESGCVSCGECAVACPTGALTFRGTVYQDRDPWADLAPLKPETVKAEELQKHPLFAGVPFAYLKWNEGAVGRLDCAPGQELCREGEFGATAFVIEAGGLEVLVGGRVVSMQTREDVIVGEMACMANQPRNATLRARQGTRVLVVRRNMLHVLQRNQAARHILFPAYRKRALKTFLLRGRLFLGLDDEQSKRCVAFLQGRTTGVEFLQVDPGQAIIRQGERADAFYIINLGHVEVTELGPDGKPLVRDYLGQGRHFGEVGLMTDLFPDVGDLPPEQRGRRTGGCTALDRVELVRIDREAFRALLDHDPEVRERLRETCREVLEKNRRNRAQPDRTLGEFTAAGLYQGQDLLALDLTKCTRCQECVKACAAGHGGLTRLVLEGDRAGKFLIPSACRSCHDPVCLVGCPVDAIHRRPADPKRGGGQSLAIVIEDHCIGCGLCAYNCPFGSIHMAERPGAAPGQSPYIATNCDLCEQLGGKHRCVYHCPHDAAHRQDGHALALALGLKPVG